MAIHCCTMEEFLLEIDRHIDLLKPGLRIEIGEQDKKVIMIHPDDFQRLKAHEADELDLGKRNKI